jgi:hypothetical protein
LLQCSGCSTQSQTEWTSKGRFGAKWEGISENFTAKKDSLMNQNGEAGTFEESKMILLALRGSVDVHLNMVKLRAPDTINWTAVENKAASAFGVRQEHVSQLQQQFLTTGEATVWERRVAALDGEAADATPAVGDNKAKLLPHHLLSRCQWVDKQRSEGWTGTNSKARSKLHLGHFWDWSVATIC